MENKNSPAKKLPVNIPVRIKNPWFWVGLMGVMLTAMGLDPTSLTSWPAVAQAGKELISNPFLLGTTAIAILGVFIDPTTAKLRDSERALTYTKPN